MLKGQLTRTAIIEQAFETAAKVGFDALSLATLAQDTNMSKSGLYAHFKSKEALQQAVLELATEHFAAIVVRPALRAPRGEARLRALFDGYLGWIGGTAARGYCLFIALGQEYRHRPGPIRERVVQVFDAWHGVIARVVEGAVATGELAPGTDARQLAFEFVGIGMSFQQSFQLLGRADAQTLARNAFEALLERARAPRNRAAGQQASASVV